MLANRKEQQAQSDRDQGQATLNRKNVICEQEVLRKLNEQLQTQITALHNTQTLKQSENEPEIKESPIVRILDELI